jgi:hypothetical protein
MNHNKYSDFFAWGHQVDKCRELWARAVATSQRACLAVRRQLPWPKTTIILAGVMGFGSVTSSG